MIYHRTVECPNCGFDTALALAVLQLVDVTTKIQKANCSKCGKEFKFSTIVEAKIVD